MGLIVDLFAGGGGASLGLRQALGRDPDIAINHDPAAIAMHAINHPTTKHLVDSVWRARPRQVTGGRPVDVLWMSPDCTHFSKAKGAAPKRDPRRSKRSRGLAWVGIRWATQVRPRAIFLENVEEFEDWGPVLKDGSPCPKRKGQTFRRFVGQLQRLGYAVEWRELRACDYGAPTIRKRLFLIARCDGRPIVWPTPTHGPALTGLLPYRTAADCIDWSLSCPSIFLTKEEGRAIGVKRPLAEATQKRIARGIKRYVIDNPRPFIVPVTHHGDSRTYDTEEPFRTLTCASRGEQALVSPVIVGCAHGEGHGRGVAEWPVDETLRTVTGSPDHAVATAFLARCDQSSAAHKNGIHPVEEPLRTVDTGGGGVLVAPSLINTRNGEREGQAPRVRDVEEPCPTVTAAGSQGAIAAAVLTKFHSESAGQSVDDPMPTVTANSYIKRPGGAVPLGVVSAFLAQHNTGMVGHSTEKPLSTMVQKGCTQALVTSHLTNFYSSNTRGGEGDPRNPFKTVTAGGWHAAEVRAFLLKYYGTAVGQNPADPLHSTTAKARFGLVTVNGEPYEIADIGMRMLTPRELFRAQGFSDDYIIDRGADGRRLTKTEQIRMCGNSVCPPLAAALVAANAKFAMTIERRKAVA